MSRASLRALAEAATAGPWGSISIGYADHDGQLADVRDALLAADRDGIVMTDMTWVEADDHHVAVTGNGPRRDRNAAFIAASRTAVPLLLDVADAAAALLWVFECQCDDDWTGRGLHEANAVCRDGDALRDALARLEREP